MAVMKFNQIRSIITLQQQRVVQENTTTPTGFHGVPHWALFFLFVGQIHSESGWFTKCCLSTLCDTGGTPGTVRRTVP